MVIPEFCTKHVGMPLASIRFPCLVRSLAQGGWGILTDFSNDEFAILHDGKDSGVSTLAIWFPKSKNGYLIFLNGNNVDKIYEEFLTKRFYLGNELRNKR